MAPPQGSPDDGAVAAGPPTISPPTSRDANISPSPSPSPSPPSPNKKVVYLIRHAESLENHRLACIRRSVSSLSRLRLPDGSDVRTGMKFFSLGDNVDSDVSDRGRRQIESMGERMGVGTGTFATERGVTLVAHSPLLRARRTCLGMLGLVASSSTSPPLVPDGGAGVGAGADPAPAVRVVELPSLLEKKPEEWIPGNYEPFRRRIEEFERWLGEQPERTVAIVGHSQFFKAMLDLDYKFGNCEVWEMTFDSTAAVAAASARGSSDAERKGEGEDAALRGGWEGLRNVYRCDV